MARAKRTPIPDLNAVMALTAFEDREVVSTGVEMPGAAGGLQQALAVDPVEWHHDEQCFVVLQCRVKKVRFDEVKGAEDRLNRVHVLEVQSATTVTETLVRDVLDAQAERIEQAKGIQRLDLAPDPDEEEDDGDD